MAEGGFPKNQEEHKGNRTQQKVLCQPGVGGEEAENESDQPHEESRNRADVHELVLKMVARKQLSKPLLQAVAPSVRLARVDPTRFRGAAGAGLSVPLWLAAEAAVPGIRLDRLSTRPAECLAAQGRFLACQNRHIIGCAGDLLQGRPRP
jgi:hypothetical protein